MGVRTLSLEQARLSRLARERQVPVENAEGAWSPGSASAYARAAKPRTSSKKRDGSWGAYLKTAAKIGLGVTLAAGAVIAGLEAGDPAFYTHNPCPRINGVYQGDCSLKSKLAPFVSTVRPVVEPIYEFDLCKWENTHAGNVEARIVKMRNKCSIAALRNAAEIDKSLAKWDAAAKAEDDMTARTQRENDDAKAQEYERAFDGRATLQGNSYDAQMEASERTPNTPNAPDPSVDETVEAKRAKIVQSSKRGVRAAGRDGLITREVARDAIIGLRDALKLATKAT